MIFHVIFSLISFLVYCTEAAANNASYITLSNQVARKQELEIITNSASNSNTMGFEEDAAIMHKFDVKQNKRKDNSFVVIKGMYKPGEQGPLKITNSPLDIAIAEPDQYFKVRTPRGVRYTLVGNVFRNYQNILVNAEGHPFLTNNNDILQIPDGTMDVRITPDGMIYADEVNLDKIGVVMLANKFALEKEGGSLYKTEQSEIRLDNYTIIPGALRGSNVNAARVMSETIEVQRSFSSTTSLLNDIGDLEKQAVNRILK